MVLVRYELSARKKYFTFVWLWLFSELKSYHVRFETALAAETARTFGALVGFVVALMPDKMLTQITGIIERLSAN